ncbi:TRAP transporter substrate-binding protein [Arcobacter sp.]|uniref:TRAP transporter substrate-binding protein n=1 Tax=Arcobacter sp. TaxID=1872629 RepID=UPI003C74AB54
MKKTFKNFVLGATVCTMIPLSSFADEITFAHGANKGNPRYEAANLFAALLPKCTNGNLTVNVAPSSTMGDDVEMLTSAISGVINITANSQGAMAQIVPEVGALGLPFLFSDLPSAWKVLDGEIGNIIDKKAQEKGLKVLTFWDNGIRNVTSSKKAILKPGDLKGMKIRTPPDAVSIAIFKALGANPSALAWSELPTALRSGAFDGQENPLTNIYSAKLHEITPYISMTAHQYQSTPVVASLMWWSSLDKKTQECVQQSAKRAGWYERGLSLMENKDLRAKMEAEGAKFFDIKDKKPFIEATKSVYKDFDKKLGNGFVAKLQAAAK